MVSTFGNILKAILSFIVELPSFVILDWKVHFVCYVLVGMAVGQYAPFLSLIYILYFVVAYTILAFLYLVVIDGRYTPLVAIISYLQMLLMAGAFSLGVLMQHIHIGSY